MFDRRSYFDSNTTNHFTSPSKVEVTVNEHRAATDDSLRLLEETYNKVRESLISRVKVDSNNVKGECYWYNSFVIDTLVVYIKLDINGIEYNFKKDINVRDFGVESTDNIKTIANALNDYSKGLVTYYILNYALENIFKGFTGKDIPDSLKREKLLK